jgi:hypothetical protein
VTQIFHSGQPSHGGNRKTFEVMKAETVGIVQSKNKMHSAWIHVKLSIEVLPPKLESSLIPWTRNTMTGITGE